MRTEYMIVFRVENLLKMSRTAKKTICIHKKSHLLQSHVMNKYYKSALTGADPRPGNT